MIDKNKIKFYIERDNSKSIKNLKFSSQVTTTIKFNRTTKTISNTQNVTCNFLNNLKFLTNLENHIIGTYSFKIIRSYCQMQKPKMNRNS